MCVCVCVRTLLNFALDLHLGGFGGVGGVDIEGCFGVAFGERVGVKV